MTEPFIYKREDPLEENKLNLIHLYLLYPSKNKRGKYIDINIIYIYISDDMMIYRKIDKTIRLDNLYNYIPNPKNIEKANKFLFNSTTINSAEYDGILARFRYDKCRTAVLKQHSLLREYLDKNNLSKYL